MRVILFGSEDCDQCQKQKEILAKHSLEYEFFDMDTGLLDGIMDEGMFALQSKHNVEHIPSILIVSDMGALKHEGCLSGDKIKQAMEFLGE